MTSKLDSASQLSALQERAEKELAWRDRRIAVLEDGWERCKEALSKVAAQRNAAEARVAELEATLTELHEPAVITAANQARLGITAATVRSIVRDYLNYLPVNRRRAALAHKGEER